MDKIDEKVIVASEILEEVGSIQDKVMMALKKICGPGRLSPELVASFLGTNFKQVYRWLSTSLYRPSLEQCQVIADFVLRVEAIREACIELLSAKPPENPDLRTALFNPRILRVLERKVPYEDKVSLLVKQVVREIAPKEKDAETCGS